MVQKAPPNRIRKQGCVSSPSSRRFLSVGGRRHYAAAPYVLPNDVQEINRLDLPHFLFRYTLQRHYLVPIRYPLSVLDVGTGTGRWAREVAQAFPQSNVVGVDIVPPEATTDTPSNCVFMPGNILEGLSFDSGSFQLVHQRMLFLAIPLAQWPVVARELARVTFLKFEIPVGVYGGRPGMMMEADVMAVVNALRGPVVAQGIATADDYDRALVAAHEESQNGPWKGVWPVHVAYGQRHR
jgi:SAM-dependent methyltransferase